MMSCIVKLVLHLHLFIVTANGFTPPGSLGLGKRLQGVLGQTLVFLRGDLHVDRRAGHHRDRMAQIRSTSWASSVAAKPPRLA